MKPLGPWVIANGVTVATRHEYAADGTEKLVASIRSVRKPFSAEFEKDVLVALIHISYPSMVQKEKEAAERGQSIPLFSPPHTLERVQAATDQWLREIGFAA